MPEEIRCDVVRLDVHRAADEKSEEQRADDRDDGEEDAGAAGLDDLLQVHPEAEEDDGGLQQELRRFRVARRERMAERQREREAEAERDRRRRPRRDAENEQRGEDGDAKRLHYVSCARKKAIVRCHASAAASAL